MTRTEPKLLKVECGHCGWTGKRKAGRLVQCPECGTFVAFQPDDHEGRARQWERIMELVSDAADYEWRKAGRAKL